MILGLLVAGLVSVVSGWTSCSRFVRPVLDGMWKSDAALVCGEEKTATRGDHVLGKMMVSCISSEVLVTITEAENEVVGEC